jgi:hypothetical protein
MEEREPIEINVQLEFKDFWRVLFGETLKNFWFIYLLTLVISLPLLAIFFYALFTSPGRIKFSPVIILPLLPLLTVLVIQWSVYSAAKRSRDAVKGTTRWLFSEDGFETFTPIARSENGWQTLEKVKEKKDCFLLYPQNNIFMVIPHRFFEGESQIEEFRELVKEQLGSKAKLKND